MPHIVLRNGSGAVVADYWSEYWMPHASAVGKPKEKIRIEPVEDPVPSKTPAPTETPVEVPEKVPA